jgi:hypothetical protein
MQCEYLKHMQADCYRAYATVPFLVFRFAVLQKIVDYDITELSNIGAKI